MTTYEFISLEGKLTTVDLEALRQVAIDMQTALSATKHPTAEASAIIDMRGRRPIWRGGWRVVYNTQFAYVQVRNYDKRGREISAEKLLATLEQAGFPVALNTKRINYDRTALEQVA